MGGGRTWPEAVWAQVCERVGGGRTWPEALWAQVCERVWERGEDWPCLKAKKSCGLGLWVAAPLEEIISPSEIEQARAVKGENASPLRHQTNWLGIGTAGRKVTWFVGIAPGLTHTQRAARHTYDAHTHIAPIHAMHVHVPRNLHHDEEQLQKWQQLGVVPYQVDRMVHNGLGCGGAHAERVKDRSAQHEW